MFFV
jgi:hypothetical protein